MATVPPALPPRQPSQPGSGRLPPSPQHAAIPIGVGENHPVQETNPPLGAQNDAQFCVSSAAAPPPLTVQTGPQPPPSQGPADSPCSTEEKRCPVQETDPAPQAGDVQLPESAGDTPAPMDQDRED